MIVKKLFFFLLFPLFCYSQDITGVWVKGNNAIEFTTDGTVKILDLKTGESILKNLKIKYRLEHDKEMRYLIYEMFFNGKLVKEEKSKYKIEDGILYLPRTSESPDGKITVLEYADAYERIKE